MDVRVEDLGVLGELRAELVLVARKQLLGTIERFVHCD
jgi:hypothetical protein